MLGVIQRTFQFLDDRMFKLLFKAIVQAHVEYQALVSTP